MSQPYITHSYGDKSPYVIICDHGGNALPDDTNLHLSPHDRARHISYDIGAFDVTKHVAALLQCRYIATQYSRLYIDCNRPIDDVTSIRTISDGTIIKGNMGLSKAEIVKRQESFTQYHACIKQYLKQHSIVISIHSFTPQIHHAKPRPWHIGILSHQFKGLSTAFIDTFQQQYPNHPIGDNKPYSGMDDYSYSIMEYMVKPKRNYLVIELRQDLISKADGQLAWAEKIHHILQQLPTK